MGGRSAAEAVDSTAMPEVNAMTTKAVVSVLLALLAGCAAHGAASGAGHSAAAPEAKVTELMSKDLKDLPGNKEGLMITVEYPPGSVDPVHRHNAHGFIYVLEGEIVMQVKGGKQVTLKPGDTYYEGPDDVHTVGRNASKSKPAKFVVFFVKEKGAPILVPAEK